MSTAPNSTSNPKDNVIKGAYEKLLNELKKDPLMFLDLASVVIVVISSNKKIVYINKKGCQLLECSKDKIQGMNWFDTFIPKRLKKAVENVFERIMAGEIKAVEFYENPVVTSQGKELFIAWENYVLQGDDGEILGTISSGTDVTRRKTALEGIMRSEEKYRNLFEASHDSIIISDIEGNILDVNSKAVEVFGYRKENFLRLHLRDIHLKNAQERFEKYAEKVKKERSLVFDMEFHNKSGDIFHGNVSASIFTFGDENVVQGIIRDVTKKRELEEELKENEKRFRKLVENSFEVMFTASIDGVLNYVAPSVKEVTGFSQKEVVGHHYTEFFPESENEVIKSIVEKLSSGKDIRDVEMKMKKKDGKLIFVSMNISPTAEDGVIMGMQGVYRDITDRKNAEAELKEKNAELRRINRLMVGRELKMAELKKKMKK